MGLKVVFMPKGSRHLQTVWSSFVYGNDDKAQKVKEAQAIADSFTRKKVDKAWYLRNKTKGGHILDQDALGIIWEEFVENEFGLEIP